MPCITFSPVAAMTQQRHTVSLLRQHLSWAWPAAFKNQPIFKDKRSPPLKRRLRRCLTATKSVSDLTNAIVNTAPRALAYTSQAHC
jgi:hypothetical protein